MEQLFYSPPGTILLSIIALVLSIFAINKILHNGGKYAGIKIALCISVFFCLVSIFGYLGFSDFSKPSPVNISPLEQLAVYPKYDLTELKKRIETLKNIEGIEWKTDHEWSGDTGRKWVYNYWMDSRDVPGSGSGVWFRIFDNSENAKASFRWEERLAGKKVKIVKISEDIDVMLCHSVMCRSSDTLFNYNSRRILHTYVRIGNMMIDFGEDSNLPDELGRLTNKNLELVCRALKK